MGFYTVYKNLCVKNGKSASGAAIEMGFSRGIASCWARGVEPKSETLLKIADFFGEDVSVFYDEEKKEPLPVQALGSLVMMPVIGSVKAGTGLMAEEEYTGEYMGIPVDTVHNNPQEYRVLSIQGDSMYPFLLEGKDKAIIHLQPEAESSEIIVAIVNGEGLIKKLNITADGTHELISFNPMYPPIKMGKDDRIYGKVVRVERIL